MPSCNLIYPQLSWPDQQSDEDDVDMVESNNKCEGCWLCAGTLFDDNLLSQELGAKMPLLGVSAIHDVRRSGTSGQCPATSAPVDTAVALTRPVTPRPGSMKGREMPAAMSPEAPVGARVPLDDMSLTAHVRQPSLRIPGKAGSGGTMRERAQRAALKVAPGNDSISQEYVTAFGPKRELPRTPQKQGRCAAAFARSAH
jgi:hypothetical protein